MIPVDKRAFRDRRTMEVCVVTEIGYSAGTVALVYFGGAQRIIREEEFEDFFADLDRWKSCRDCTGPFLPARQDFLYCNPCNAKRVKDITDEEARRSAVWTGGDVLGRRVRDAAIGVGACRLGCACMEHRPAREAWTPSVDEFDLLPDAR